jgi:hypothetical protein
MSNVAFSGSEKSAWPSSAMPPSKARRASGFTVSVCFSIFSFEGWIVTGVPA